jgi:putative molybdopterin biosynthesis protein
VSIYLKDIPLQEAEMTLFAALESAGLAGPLGFELIPLDEQAASRVLGEACWARVSSPHYHASAMDGYAVRSGDTKGASLTAPIDIVVLAGGEQRYPSARYLDTGDALPAGYDAVIPIENVEALDRAGQMSAEIRHPATIRIRAAVPPWSHVRPLGEDIVASQLVFPAGRLLRPVDLGALAAAGFAEIKVARKPRVAIIPTGTELVNVGGELSPGVITEFNSIVMAGQVNSWGGLALRYPIVPDDMDRLAAVVSSAAETSDLILLNAGSSAGAEDFSARVIAQLGQVLVHGVAVRPGHPVILGTVHSTNREVPIIGVPGYPVSATLTCEIFVRPLLYRWTGRSNPEADTIQAFLTRKVHSPGGDDDFVRMAVGKVGDRVLAAPLSRGAGVITSLTHADGIVVFPRGVQGAEAGDEVEVRLLRDRSEIEKTIFCIGSHDMTLDLLAQFLEKKDRRLVSANTGSMGGLLAVQRNEAHVAGSHLLDPGTGTYNRVAVQKYLSGTRVRVFGFVERVQGLMVEKGNPKQVSGLMDLTRPDLTYVNRQRGAGTRVLLDYHLDKLGIHPESIQGYNQEEYTHLGVAAAIASGRAHCGLGIPAAARALDLDFIELYSESYELIVPVVFQEGDLLGPLFDVMEDPDFRQSVLGLPGYGIERMGKLIAEVG